MSPWWPHWKKDLRLPSTYSLKRRRCVGMRLFTEGIAVNSVFCDCVRMTLFGDRQEDMSTQLVGPKPMIDWGCTDRWAAYKRHSLTRDHEQERLFRKILIRFSFYTAICDSTLRNHIEPEATLEKSKAILLKWTNPSGACPSGRIPAPPPPLEVSKGAWPAFLFALWNSTHDVYDGSIESGIVSNPVSTCKSCKLSFQGLGAAESKCKS